MTTGSPVNGGESSGDGAPIANGTDRVVHFAAGGAGFIIASGIALASEVPVAWAAPMYFWLGWPAMALVIYLLARLSPERPWRWTLSMMAGQVFSSIFFGNAATVPVALAYVTVLSVPQFIAGGLGAKAAIRKSANNINKQEES
jgi:hypothetical protein